METIKLIKVISLLVAGLEINTIPVTRNLPRDENPLSGRNWDIQAEHAEHHHEATLYVQYYHFWEKILDI